MSGMSTRCLIAAFMPFDDGDGVAVAALLEDGNVDRALPIDAHDVVLQRAGVFRLADIGHQHR